MRLSIVLLAAAAACAQPYQPTSEEMGQIRAKLGELTAFHTQDPDVEIYRKAGEWILRYPEEFYTKAYVANALKVLDHGIARARELQGGMPAWAQQKGRIVRGYRSAVDDSVQPYALVIPDSYDGSRPVRLDLVLHGRGATLNEVSFIAAHESATPVPSSQDFIQLEVYGRGNNAYRWAGEADVFEALAAVQKLYRIDPDRIVLRGFSMGGAGAWHIGLHYPARWVALEAGAGFTETRVYAKLKEIPLYQASTLHIYDAVDYSPNAVDLAVVGYGGEIDAQLKASVNIREALTREGFHFKPDGLNWTTTDLRAIFLVGPQTPHRFHPESKKTSDEFLNAAVAKGREEHPARIHFVTYTPRYDGSPWIKVDALERQYERTEVDADKNTIRTKNVARLELAANSAVVIDGKQLRGRTFEKKNGSWSTTARSGLRKHHGLQGPIDDAFLESFICVRPTGKPISAAANSYATRALDEFARNFAKYFRGDPHIKEDTAISDADIASSNLILFGDPGSNSVLGRVMGKLPLRWTADSITLAGQKFTTADHVPLLIYPNPLNPSHYVVINSGHTFGESDLRGTNALLYPRLGDYAVLKTDGSVETAGLFNEEWK